MAAVGLGKLRGDFDERMQRQPDATIFHLAQDHTIRVSWKAEVRAQLRQIFSGAAFRPILDEARQSIKHVLRSRVFVALHMHAGDGNVHTNIPVNSDDYEMLQVAPMRRWRASCVLARDAGRRDFRRARHRHHQARISDRRGDRRIPRLQATIDPQGRFNKGKLLPGGRSAQRLHAVVRPDGHESLIMQQSEIGAIADSIKDCLRCGKCKPVCATHVPRANLLYRPRNKILATSLLIEAFLYEEQTRRGISVKHLDEFGDVADHCTVCHKCVTPCPVDIDFGDVSINMRNLLRKHGTKKFNPGTARRWPFFNATDPTTIKAIRMGLIEWGVQAAALRLRVRRGTRWRGTRPAIRPPPSASAPLKEQVIHFINKPMPGSLPKKTARALLGIEDDKVVPIIRNPQIATGRHRGGVLFSRLRLGAPVLAGRPGDPGDAVACRRADGAAAGLSVLRLSADAPSGEVDKAEKITTNNRVLFHRVANTLNYLDIKTVVVSAGPAWTSCRDTNSTRYSPVAGISTSTNT